MVRSLRAAVDNPRIARAVGIDVNRLFTITFVGGCALAGFGGIVGAEMLPLEPFYALRYLVLFLVVVAVGGHGSFKGSFFAALTLGIIDTAGKYICPEICRLHHVHAGLRAAALAALRTYSAEGGGMTDIPDKPQAAALAPLALSSMCCGMRCHGSSRSHSITSAGGFLSLGTSILVMIL